MNPSLSYHSDQRSQTQNLGILRYSLIRAVVFWIFFWISVAVTVFRIAREYYSGDNTISPLERSKRSHTICCLWGKFLLTKSPGWSFRVEGRENLPQDHAFVVVSNHISSVDILALFAINFQFRWLSKQEVFSMPLIGTAMRMVGYVPVKRGDEKSHKRAFELSAEWLAKGIAMVFFPEGSRSVDGKLKEFKTGAFRLAINENVPVVPIVLEGTGDMLRKGTLIPNPAQVNIKILPPISALENEEPRAFSERIRAVYLKETINEI